MATPSLSDLLSIPTLAQILDGEVMPSLRSAGVKVTDWITGGAYSALATGAANMWLEGRTAIAAMSAARFGDYVFGFSSAPGGIDVTGWATTYAKQVYGVDRIAATNTKRNIRFTNSTATVYGPVAAGAIMVVCTVTGNRYVNDSAVTIAASGTTDATFRSEFTVDSTVGRTYTDSIATSWQFVTASYPGVTLSNPSLTYSSISSVGAGGGTISLGGLPAGSHSVVVRIDVSGVVGGGSWSTNTDNAGWVSQGAIAAIVNLGGTTGINITPADNATNPSFPAGALFYFTAPGGDVVQAGRDEESPQDLGTRCKALFPLLAFTQDANGNFVPPVSPTATAYQALALSANTQVKVCYVKTDGTINNKLHLLVAGQGAVLSPAVVANVQNFWNLFAPVTDVVSVESPNARAITLAGATVQVRAAMLATAQAAFQTAAARYLAGVDSVSALNINGLVDRSYLNAILRATPGVTHVDDGLTINAVAADLQLPVTAGTYELATWSPADLTSGLTWTTV